MHRTTPSGKTDTGLGRRISRRIHLTLAWGVIATGVMGRETSPEADRFPNERSPATIRTASLVPLSEPSPVTSQSPSPRPAAGAALPPPVSRSRVEALLRSRYGGEWTAEADPGEEIATIHGGIIPEAGKSTRSALALARALARLLGVPGNQLQSPPTPPESTALSVSYYFPQSLDGVPVFQGGMQILARSLDGAVYLINSDLKRVDPIDSTDRGDPETARVGVLDHYRGRNPELLESDAQAVIWANSQPHQLAWKFIVGVQKPRFDRLLVIYGTQSRRIILEQSELVRD